MTISSQTAFSKSTTSSRWNAINNIPSLILVVSLTSYNLHTHRNILYGCPRQILRLSITEYLRISNWKFNNKKVLFLSFLTNSLYQSLQEYLRSRREIYELNAKRHYQPITLTQRGNILRSKTNICTLRLTFLFWGKGFPLKSWQIDIPHNNWGNKVSQRIHI